MSNAELARQAIENRQDRFEATEAYRYGGEEGSEVLPINEEQVKTAENLIKRFGVSIERKLQNDPENLTQAEVILLDLQKKPEGEPYSPHEMAGLYLVMRHMEGELNNPNSAISQERQFGQGHKERDTTRD